MEVVVAGGTWTRRGRTQRRFGTCLRRLTREEEGGAGGGGEKRARIVVTKRVCVDKQAQEEHSSSQEVQNASKCTADSAAGTTPQATITAHVMRRRQHISAGARGEHRKPALTAAPTCITLGHGYRIWPSDLLPQPSVHDKERIGTEEHQLQRHRQSGSHDRRVSAHPAAWSEQIRGAETGREDSGRTGLSAN